MERMLTLFGKDIEKLKYNELKQERWAQSFLLSKMRSIRKECEKQREKEYTRGSEKRIAKREDKIAFLTMYIKHIEALIEEIDYWMARRYEPKRNRVGAHTKEVIQAENAKRRQLYLNDNYAKWNFSKTQDGLYVSWDKDKFDSIARDRGYQTDEMVLSAVAEELRMSRINARLAIQNGRFTWGQVLCLGALMQMTPKEFCDVFLSGYFVERYGEFRAEYDNLDKAQLLKRAAKSESVPQEQEDRSPKPDPVFEEIYVDADGRPLGEEDEWFD
ncbi:MAG: hypothetical protein IIY21_21495 [Clostridiales bacterium]|nr:hypothetical protein [Clostridiales bacterium]